MKPALIRNPTESQKEKIRNTFIQLIAPYPDEVNNRNDIWIIQRPNNMSDTISPNLDKTLGLFKGTRRDVCKVAANMESFYFGTEHGQVFTYHPPKVIDVKQSYPQLFQQEKKNAS